MVQLAFVSIWFCFCSPVALAVAYPSCPNLPFAVVSTDASTQPPSTTPFDGCTWLTQCPATNSTDPDRFAAYPKSPPRNLLENPRCSCDRRCVLYNDCCSQGDVATFTNSETVRFLSTVHETMGLYNVTFPFSCRQPCPG